MHRVGQGEGWERDPEREGDVQGVPVSPVLLLPSLGL